MEVKIYAQEGLEVLGLIWFWLVSNVSYTGTKKYSIVLIIIICVGIIECCVYIYLLEIFLF